MSTTAARAEPSPSPSPCPAWPANRPPRGADIEFDTAEEVPTDVTLAHYYDGTVVTDEQLEYGIEAFGRQILRPQVLSIATRAPSRNSPTP